MQFYGMHIEDDLEHVFFDVGYVGIYRIKTGEVFWINEDYEILCGQIQSGLTQEHQFNWTQLYEMLENQVYNYENDGEIEIDEEECFSSSC